MEVRWIHSTFFSWQSTSEIYAILGDVFFTQTRFLTWNAIFMYFCFVNGCLFLHVAIPLKCFFVTPKSTLSGMFCQATLGLILPKQNSTVPRWTDSFYQLKEQIIKLCLNEVGFFSMPDTILYNSMAARLAQIILILPSSEHKNFCTDTGKAVSLCLRQSYWTTKSRGLMEIKLRFKSLRSKKWRRLVLNPQRVFSTLCVWKLSEHD